MFIMKTDIQLKPQRNSNALWSASLLCTTLLAASAPLLAANTPANISVNNNDCSKPASSTASAGSNTNELDFQVPSNCTFQFQANPKTGAAQYMKGIFSNGGGAL
jgi:hypothetical protein